MRGNLLSLPAQNAELEYFYKVSDFLAQHSLCHLTQYYLLMNISEPFLIKEKCETDFAHCSGVERGYLLIFCYVEHELLFFL